MSFGLHRQDLHKHTELMTQSIIFKVGLLAIEAHHHASQRKLAQGDLTSAYEAWKREKGIERIESGSPAWNSMLKDTKPEYCLLQEAKRLERNAWARLGRAITRTNTPKY